MSDFSNIRWITIDATGTLIDPTPSVGHVYGAVLKRHGVEARHELLQQRFIEVFRNLSKTPRHFVNEESERKFWRDLALGTVEPWATGIDGDAFFEDAYDAFARAENWRAPEGADALLRNLKGRGYRLALLSNADGRTRGILEGLGLAPYLEQVILSCEVGFEKPDVRLFRGAEKILGATPAEILHVGDSQRNDGEGPRAAGWRALVIGRDIDKLVALDKLLS